MNLINAPILVDDIDANRDAWVEMRKKTIGASDVSVILGLSKWQTPLGLWMEKTGRAAPPVENDAMWYGRENEATVAKLYQRRTGKEIVRVNKTYRHPIHEWLTASPDYLAVGEEPELLECKSPGLYELDQWGETEAPNHAHAQLVTQMAVTGITAGVCGAIVGGSTRDSFFPEFRFDVRLWDQIFPILEDFHKFVVNDTPPPVRNGDMDNLNRLFNPNVEQTIDLDQPEFAEVWAVFAMHKMLAEKLGAAKDQVKELDKQKDLCEAQIRAAMGNYRRAVYNSAIIEIKTVNRKAYAVKETQYETFKVKYLEEKNGEA